MNISEEFKALDDLKALVSKCDNDFSRLEAPEIDKLKEIFKTLGEYFLVTYFNNLTSFDDEGGLPVDLVFEENGNYSLTAFAKWLQKELDEDWLKPVRGSLEGFKLFDDEKKTTYKIIEELGEFVLYTYVETNFGGDAKNYVMSSTEREVVQAVADKYKWKEKQDA